MSQSIMFNCKTEIHSVNYFGGVKEGTFVFLNLVMSVSGCLFDTCVNCNNQKDCFKLHFQVNYDNRNKSSTCKKSIHFICCFFINSLQENTSTHLVCTYK